MTPRNILLIIILSLIFTTFIILDIKTKQFKQRVDDSIINHELISQSENILLIAKKIDPTIKVEKVNRGKRARETMIANISAQDPNIRYPWNVGKSISIVIGFIALIILIVIFSDHFANLIKVPPNIDRVALDYNPVRNLLIIKNNNDKEVVINKYYIKTESESFKSNFQIAAYYKINELQSLEIRDFTKREGWFLYIASLHPLNGKTKTTYREFKYYEDTIPPDIPKVMKIVTDKLNNPRSLYWNHSYSNDVLEYNIYKVQSNKKEKLNKNRLLPDKSKKYFEFPIYKTGKIGKIDYYLEVIDNYVNKSKLIKF